MTRIYFVFDPFPQAVSVPVGARFGGNMQHESLLLTTVEVAAVFIGFATVFLTLRATGKEFSRAHNAHARGIVIAGSMMLTAPLIPIIVIPLVGSATAGWIAFHSFVLIFGSSTAALSAWFITKMNREERRETGWLHIYIAYVSIALSGAASLYGLLSWQLAETVPAALIGMYGVAGSSMITFISDELPIFDFRNP